MLYVGEYSAAKGLRASVWVRGWTRHFLPFVQTNECCERRALLKGSPFSQIVFVSAIVFSARCGIVAAAVEEELGHLQSVYFVWRRRSADADAGKHDIVGFLSNMQPEIFGLGLRRALIGRGIIDGCWLVSYMQHSSHWDDGWPCLHDLLVM